MTLHIRFRGRARALAAAAALGLIVCTAAGAAADDPVAADDFVTTTVGAPVSFNPLANDVDPNGEILRMDRLGNFTGADPLLLSLFSDGLTGETVFEPRAPYTGVFSFQYVIADESGNIDKARVFVSVRETDVPTIAGQGAYDVENGRRTAFEFAGGLAGGSLTGSFFLQRFRGDNITFVADSIESLTGSGPDATMTGTGTFNNEPGYSFSLQLVEKGDPGGFKGDRIGVEIRDLSDAVVYSTQGTTAISHGNVLVN
jgi:hypothetical protein